LLDRTLERVAIVDDTAGVRKAFSYPVQDLDLTPVMEAGPLPDLDASVRRLTSQAQAALCDFQLRVSNYAAFDGAQLVARLYEASMPAVLCTRFEKSSIDEIRRFRPLIPCLLTPNELSDVSLAKGFETCLREFRNEYAEDRRAWRTLIRVQNVEGHYAYLFVPAWSSSEGLRLLLSDLPGDFAAKLRPGFRCHAQVNLGAVKQEDLYFTNWEG
jgi:hypothetical protein